MLYRPRFHVWLLSCTEPSTKLHPKAIIVQSRADVYYKDAKACDIYYKTRGDSILVALCSYSENVKKAAERSSKGQQPGLLLDYIFQS